MSDTPDTVVAAVRVALNTILDPCSLAQSAPVGFVDMGLVLGVDAVAAPGGGHDVTVRLRTTMPGCMYRPFFERAADHAVREVPSVRAVTLIWDHDADWTPDDMNPAVSEALAQRRRRIRAAAQRARAVPAGG